MHSFAYKNGTLYCENVNLQELADKESTPLYVYSKQTYGKPQKNYQTVPQSG